MINADVKKKQNESSESIIQRQIKVFSRNSIKASLSGDHGALLDQVNINLKLTVHVAMETTALLLYCLRLFFFRYKSYLTSGKVKSIN